MYSFGSTCSVKNSCFQKGTSALGFLEGWIAFLGEAVAIRRGGGTLRRTTGMDGTRPLFDARYKSIRG